MGTWSQLSKEISETVQKVGESIVTIQAGAGTATGIVVDENTILTSAHAIAEETKIRAFQTPDEPVNLTMLGTDYGCDLALLSANGKIGAPARFAENPQLAVGDLVIAIARTRRGNLVASSGILSGLMGEWHTYRGKKIEAFIRPDLTLYRGFSGGALVGADQRIIGMNSAALRRGSPLVLPYATIQRVSSVLREKGYVPGPYLGLGLQPLEIPQSLKQKLNISEKAAALVVHVATSSPADEAGVMIGDVLLSIADHHFGEEQTSSILSRLAPGQKAGIMGLRGGQRFTADVVIGERPRARG
ncbi:MAG: serine protease [Acidobacteria bacterium]|nr:serine protease [Acidobacteriota bacterium]